MTTLSVMGLFATISTYIHHINIEFHYAECHYAECRSAECRSADLPPVKVCLFCKKYIFSLSKGADLN